MEIENGNSKEVKICVTRRLVSLFESFKARISDNKLYRFLMGFVALCPIAVIIVLWLGMDGVTFGFLGVLVVLLIVSVYVDVVFILPILVLILIFWSLISLAGLIDLIFFTRHIIRPPNRVAIVINAINLPLIVMLVWLYLEM